MLVLLASLSAHALAPIGRRAALSGAAAAAASASAAPPCGAANANGETKNRTAPPPPTTIWRPVWTRSVTLPLAPCGGTLCAEFSIEGSRLRGIVDTGSPFLTAPPPGQ